MKILKARLFTYLAIALFAAITTASAQAELISVGTAIRTGSLTNGFPDFLSTGIVNGTTQAWNLGGTAGDTLFNGITVVDISANSTAGDLTTSGGSFSSGAPVVNFNSNPDLQDAERQAIFQPGIQNFAPGFGTSPVSYNIAAIPGDTYQVEILGSAQNGNRTGDITVDGTLFADDLWSPAAAGGVTLVYRFEVVADADGIDILIGQGNGVAPSGAAASTTPIYSAISVTNTIPEPSSLILVSLGMTGLCVLRRRSR